MPVQMSNFVPDVEQGVFLFWSMSAEQILDVATIREWNDIGLSIRKERLVRYRLLSDILYTAASTSDRPQSNDAFVLESSLVDHIDFQVPVIISAGVVAVTVLCVCFECFLVPFVFL
jgi:hypothetical protein